MRSFHTLQFPVAFAVFGFEAVRLFRENKNRLISGNTESVCEATIEWTPLSLIFCALCGLVGGIVGGLLGSGGGFVLGPLLLEIGVIPQVQKHNPIDARFVFKKIKKPKSKHLVS